VAAQTNVINRSKPPIRKMMCAWLIDFYSGRNRRRRSVGHTITPAQRPLRAVQLLRSGVQTIYRCGKVAGFHVPATWPTSA
jgi:hypothetical protein